MLPIKKQGSALVIKKTYREQKIEKLKNSEVIIKLSDTEMMIAQAGVDLPIKNITDKDLVEKISVAAKWICRDVGIRTWNDADVMKYDVIRFFTTLKNYYKDLSLKEVKIAFELAAVGELDEWLPKDKNGNPDKNHYQNFSMEYYTKILKAYKAKKNKVWHKANKALPVKREGITKEQRIENKRILIKEIYDAFEKYKAEGKEPNFILSIFINELLHQGLIKERTKAGNKAINKAYNAFILSDVPKSQKKPVIAKFHKNNIDNIILRQANTIQANLDIKYYFDKLILEKKDIKTVLK